jgi:hypothetical protein
MMHAHSHALDTLSPKETIEGLEMTSYQSEHALLRNEMNTYFEQIQSLEVWSLTAIFVSYGWLVSFFGDPFKGFPFFALIYFLPFAIACITKARIIAFGSRIARLGYYIAYLERKLGMGSGEWWLGALCLGGAGAAV